MDEIIVPGDDEKFRGQVCITSNTRPDPTHCWSRAALHCLHFKEFHWRVQAESSLTCHLMAEVIYLNVPWHRPRESGFGWGKGWPGLR